jgi:hypothetical protein
MSTLQPNGTPIENEGETTEKPKDNLEEIREKKREIEKYLPEIESLKEKCYQLNENIQYEKKKKKSLEQEIEYRKKRLNEYSAQYRAITGKQTMNSKDEVKKIKLDIINDKLEELLAEKIPEAGLKLNSKGADNQNEDFKELIHANIKLVLTNDSSTSKNKIEQETRFRISTTLTFSALKLTACKFWNIDNPNEYLITDESESIIYNEDMAINNYMRNYSVRSNLLRLIKTNILNSRIKITPLQDSRIKDLNQFESKSKGDKKFIGSSSSTQIINEFINYYTGLKPYYSETKKGEEKNEKISNSVQPKDLDTSLIMFLLILLFFVFTIIVIYRKENDILQDKRKIDYLTFLFDNSKVTSPFALANYLLDTIFGQVLKNRMENHTDNESICDKDNFTLFKWLYNSNNVELSQCLSKEYIDNINGYCLNISKFRECSKDKYINADGIISLSSVHIVIEKVKKKNCYSGRSVENIIKKNFSCYEVDYENGNKLKDDLNFDDFTTNLSDIDNDLSQKLYGNIIKSFKNYKSNKKANVKYSIHSLGGDFNGDGYHADFPLRNDIL